MKTSTKILIGVGVLGAGFLAYKLLTKPKPVPAPAPAPDGPVNKALTDTVQNVQSIPTNIKPGALIGSTGAKNILDRIKQNVAAGTGIPKPAINPAVSIKPATTATTMINPATSPTRTIIPPKPVTRPGVNQFGIKFY
jgi:hypothetical protein